MASPTLFHPHRPFLALAAEDDDAIELAARSFDWLLVDAVVETGLARAAKDRAALAYGRRLQVVMTMDVDEIRGSALVSKLLTLAGSDAVDGAIMRFTNGIRGLHEFAARVLPVLRSEANLFR